MKLISKNQTIVLILTITIMTLLTLSYENFTTLIFQVRQNRIYDPTGQPFVVRGTTMFDYLLSNGDFGPHPSGYAPYLYPKISSSLQEAKKLGINLIRLAVEPANMIKQSDTNNQSSTYPTEPEILDEIITKTTSNKMVLQLQVNNASFTNSLRFISYLANRYKNNPYVWINPSNEINCNFNRDESPDPMHHNDTSTICANSNIWLQQMSDYIRTIRQTGFNNPIVVNGLLWGGQFPDEILKFTSTQSNIILGAHIYANDQTEFKTPPEWTKLSQNYAIIADEVGFVNTAITNIPSPNWSKGFLQFMTRWCLFQGGSGVTSFNWYAYVPGLQMLDHNSMHDRNGLLTEWGKIYVSYFLKPVTQPMSYNPNNSKILGIDDFFGDGKKELLILQNSILHLKRLENDSLVEDQIVLDQKGFPFKIDPQSYEAIGLVNLLGQKQKQLVLYGGSTLQLISFSKNQVTHGQTVMDSSGTKPWILNKSSYSIVGFGNFLKSTQPDLLLSGAGTLQAIRIQNGRVAFGYTLQNKSVPFLFGINSYSLIGVGNFLGNESSDILAFGENQFQVWHFKDYQFQYGIPIQNSNGSDFKLMPFQYKPLLVMDLSQNSNSEIILYGAGGLQALYLEKNVIRYGIPIIDFTQ